MTFGPVWFPLGERVADAELPFLPFESTQFGLVMSRESSPFYLHPEHRNLPHWTARNDER